MKFRVIKTDQIVEILYPTPDTFLMVLCGLIEDVKPDVTYTKLPRGNGVGVWRIVSPAVGRVEFPSVRVDCETCKQSQTFVDQRTVDQKTGRISRSTMGNAIFHHCKKKESIPKEIAREYEAIIMQGFKSSEVHHE